MKTLTLSGKHIHSLSDIYAQIVRDLHLDDTLFGYNLDALYDVLSEKNVTHISLVENQLLKKHMQTKHPAWLSEYEVFLDLVTDLPYTTITISW